MRSLSSTSLRAIHQTIFQFRLQALSTQQMIASHATRWEQFQGPITSKGRPEVQPPLSLSSSMLSTGWPANSARGLHQYGAHVHRGEQFQRRLRIDSISGSRLPTRQAAASAHYGQSSTLHSLEDRIAHNVSSTSAALLDLSEDRHAQRPESLQ